MNAIVPHVFEDQLVRSVIKDDEPWFVGKDVCQALGYRDAHAGLRMLDDDEKGTHNIGTPGGEQTMAVVCEAGVFRLIFGSRKPEAERFKRWLAHEVLPSLRREGVFAMPHRKVTDVDGNKLDFTSEAVPLLTAKLALVREARHLWGHERARNIWKQLGLAVPVDDVAQGTPEGRHVLSLITLGEFSGHRIKTLLNSAMEGDEPIIQLLRSCGILAKPEEDGFVIANRHPELERILQGTVWARGKWQMALRRLPGAVAVKPASWPPGVNARGIFIPMTNMDFDNAEP
jgi:prophage antirepressor-like protein